MRLRFAWTLGLVAMATLCAGISSGAAKTAALKVHSGDLKCVVLDAEGTSMSDMTLRVLREGKVVSQAVTDKEGACLLKNLPVGKCDLYAGLDQPMKLLVAADTETATLRIVLPARESHAVEYITPEGGSLGITRHTWMWVGGGAVVAVVAAPVIYNAGGSSGGSSSTISD